jgi:hypothetical protein
MMFAAVVVVVVVEFAFDVFETLASVVVFVVVAVELLAACCWHAPRATASASAAAAVRNLADDFKAKMCMRRLSSNRAAGRVSSVRRVNQAVEKGLVA